MAANPKIVKLLDSLRSATTLGKLRWSKSFPAGYFEAKVKDVKISISKTVYKDASEAYYVSIYDEKNQMIEDDLFEEGSEGFGLAREVHEQARRNALRVDELLDDVIADLGSSVQ